MNVLGVLWLLMTLCSGLAHVLTEKYTQVKNTKYVVPGSSTVSCPVGIRCTVLYCARICTSGSDCRSFSYSSELRECVFNPWYYAVLSVASVSSYASADGLWSTYDTNSRACDSQPCQNGGTCRDEVNGDVNCICPNGNSGDFCQTKAVAVHCQAILKEAVSAPGSGVYTVSPDGVTSFDVYCDHVTDGGGWVVIQRRQDGLLTFDRSLQEYKTGFGDLQGEFWLGLDHIQAFTSRLTHELRVEVGSSSSSFRTASYSSFNLDSSDYSLSYDSFTGGDAGDCIRPQKGYPFSTPPPNDQSFCASLYYGGWWYANNCMYCNLNGRYGANTGGGVKWYTYSGSRTSHNWVEMKIRPST